MSEEVLWYAARISGLMGWILSFGALAAGLLARSEPAHGTSAGLWAAETRNLLGRLSIVAMLVHGSAIASVERFGLPLESVLTGRQAGRWLLAAIVVGVLCAWAAVAVEFVRLAFGRLSAAGDLVLLATSTAIVAGGAYHGWQVGSDTQNPVAVAVVVLSGILLLGAAAIGLTSVLDGRGSLGAAPRALSANGQQEPVRGNGEHPIKERVALASAGSVGPAAPNHPMPPTPPNAGSFPPVNPVDQRLAVSLSRQIEDNGSSSVFDRGPEISSARDVGAPETEPSSSAEVGDAARVGPDAEKVGSWLVRKVPDAPKPAHRDPKRR